MSVTPRILRKLLDAIKGRTPRGISAQTYSHLHGPKGFRVVERQSVFPERLGEFLDSVAKVARAQKLATLPLPMYVRCLTCIFSRSPPSSESPTALPEGVVVQSASVRPFDWMWREFV